MPLAGYELGYSDVRSDRSTYQLWHNHCPTMAFNLNSFTLLLSKQATN